MPTRKRRTRSRATFSIADSPEISNFAYPRIHILSAMFSLTQLILGLARFTVFLDRWAETVFLGA